MDRRELALRLYRAGQLHGGHFKLKSGDTSPDYFDKYLPTRDPKLLRAVVEAMVPLIPTSVKAIAGLELGAVAPAVLLSQLTGLPLFLVRKAPKEYGTCKMIEGGDVRDLNVLIVEDVVTTGSQIVIAAMALREEGAIVEHALAMVDRGRSSRESLERHAIALKSLFTMQELAQDEATIAGLEIIEVMTEQQPAYRPSYDSTGACTGMGGGMQNVVTALRVRFPGGMPFVMQMNDVRGQEEAVRALAKPVSRETA